MHGGSYDDTLINTYSVLKKAGIKQIYVYQTLPEITKTFASKTMYINSNGYINKVTICFAKIKSTDFALCVTDTIVYDSSNRIVTVQTTDNKPNKYDDYRIKYIGPNNSLVQYHLHDSLYQSYNIKRQLVTLRKVQMEKEIENTRFYYNPDDLPDSIVNNHWGTLVFERSAKGGNKLIETKNPIASFKWVYNLLGQCINTTFILKERPGLVRKPGYKGKFKTEVKYFYNQNGTLSKVITQSFDKPDFTMYYSYL